MDDQPSITILGKEIEAAYMTMNITELKYFDKNPRVYSCIHGAVRIDDVDDLQERIHAKMKQEPSVTNLIPQIREHGGLIDPILVRMDTREVIEGNSRLAAYKILSQEDPDKWGRIKCLAVTNLTPEQQDAYLNQIHVIGKTSWTAYEKANFAYVRFKEGVPIDQIAKRFSETDNEIDKRIATIQLMEQNRDTERSRFSHYNVMIRNRSVSGASEKNPILKNFILSEIKKNGDEDTSRPPIEAKDIRDKLPVIIEKPKQLKKFLSGQLSLDDAYQNAKSSGPKNLVKGAHERVDDISKGDVQKLDKPDFNDLKLELKKLKKQILRLDGIINEVGAGVQND